MHVTINELITSIYRTPFFSIYIDFTHIAASNTVTDDVNWKRHKKVTHRIFNTNL